MGGLEGAADHNAYLALHATQGICCLTELHCLQRALTHLRTTKCGPLVTATPTAMEAHREIQAESRRLASQAKRRQERSAANALPPLHVQGPRQDWAVPRRRLN